MFQKLRFLSNLCEWVVKRGAPHQDGDEPGPVRRLHHALLLTDVEMDDFLFEMSVLQQLLQVLPKTGQTHIKNVKASRRNALLQTFTAAQGSLPALNSDASKAFILPIFPQSKCQQMGSKTQFRTRSCD